MLSGFFRHLLKRLAVNDSLLQRNHEGNLGAISATNNIHHPSLNLSVIPNRYASVRGNDMYGGKTGNAYRPNSDFACWVRDREGLDKTVVSDGCTLSVTMLDGTPLCLSLSPRASDRFEWLDGAA
jgi:hypothetical protein